MFCTVCYARSYSAVDSYVAQAPNISSRSQLNTLVNFLTKKYDKQEDKARSILAWIVKNIDYDDYRFEQTTKQIKRPSINREMEDPGDILITRLGMCGEISQLYVDMAKQAGLTARVVSGYAGKNLSKTNLDEAAHAWVIVEIDNKEEFIDPTWAISDGGRGATAHIRNNSQYRAEIRRRSHRVKQTKRERSVNEEWFLTKPKIMIKTHFPHDKKDQLLEQPIQLNKFLSGTRA